MKIHNNTIDKAKYLYKVNKASGKVNIISQIKGVIIFLGFMNFMTYSTKYSITELAREFSNNLNTKVLKVISQ